MRWLLDVFQLSAKDWFIKSYLLLMVMAPILNAYTKNTEEKTQRHVMIAFFLFEAIFGWAMGGRRFFVNGYGPLHFIGLYITAQYIHNQVGCDESPNWLRKLFTMPKWVDFGIILLAAVVNTVLVVEGSFFLGSTQSLSGLVYAYTNPLVIIGALYLLLLFSKIKMPHLRLVNWLGASSFAVYLFHGEATIRSEYFTPQVQWIYNRFTGIGCIGMIFMFLCLTYLVSVLIDQLRILSWNRLWDTQEKKC